MACPACGAAAPLGARFCPECGASLAPRRDERRLVTVVMADIVGFTGLSERRDPEHVKNLIDACFERLVADVASHGGDLDKIVGDELVATFGATVAHEDDAERAVRTALRMLQTLRDAAPDHGGDLALRIGVNTGEVVVGALRAGGDSTVTGDVVNTASRLQAAAEPGQVVVGAATYHATRHAIRYEPLGTLAVRGRREPVEAWTAVDAPAPPGRRTRPTRSSDLVGREDELTVLTSAITRSFRRRRAALLLVSGEAGVGKTRLLEELGRVATLEHDARVLDGHCAPYGESGPWEPIAQGLRHQLGIDATTPPDELRASVRAGVVDILPESAASEVERLVDGLVGLFGASANPAVDPGRARDEAVRALLALVEALARDRPIVLGLSDVHWADDLVLDLLDRAIDGLRGLPVVVVATARPGIEDRWHPIHGRTDLLHLHLDPLDGTATDELARSLLGERAGPAVLELLRERSGGNPLFVEELAVLAREAPAGVDGDDELAQRLRALPATLHGLVAARLDALPGEHRSLLADLAVVGTAGPVAAVSVLRGGRADEEILDLGELVAIDGDSFRFQSELVREVSYATLTKAERARRHAALAPLFATLGDLGVEPLAHHLAEAAELASDLGPVDGVPGDVRAQALAALTAAAGQSQDAEHWLRAAQLWDRVLDLVERDDGELRWTALLGRAQGRAGQHELDAAEDDVRQVLDEAQTAGATPTVARALTELGRILQQAERFDEAEAAFAESATHLRELADARGVADALRGLGLSHLFRGDLDGAERLFSDALASYRGEGDRRGEAWALQNLAWIAFNRGLASQAEERLSQSAELFVEIGDWGGLGWALGLLAWVRFLEGRLDEAEELARRIEVEARELGNRWARGMMGILLANIALWRGRVADAAERAAVARDLFRGIGDRWGEVQASAPLARCFAMLGRWDDYEAAIADLEAAAAHVADPGVRAMGQSVHGLVAAQRGDGEAALAAVGDAVPRDPGAPVNTEIAATRGLALLQVGRASEAREVLGASHAATEVAVARASLAGLYAIALLATGEEHGAGSVLTDAAVAEGTWRDRALAGLARGLLHTRRGERGEAEEAFDSTVGELARTDARVEQAVATVVRHAALAARWPEAALEPGAEAVVVGVDPAGWERLVDVALGRQAVSDPSPRSGGSPSPT